MEEIIQFDKHLLLMVNGSDSAFLDWVVMTLTNAKTWIPLYLSLLYVVIKANRNVRGVLMIMAAAGLCVLLAGTIDDEIVKPLVARWRPTHDPQIGGLVDVVDGYRGGNYGFFSAHASQHFFYRPVLFATDASALADHWSRAVVADELLDAHVSWCSLPG